MIPFNPALFAGLGLAPFSLIVYKTTQAVAGEERFFVEISTGKISLRVTRGTAGFLGDSQNLALFTREEMQAVSPFLDHLPDYNVRIQYKDADAALPAFFRDADVSGQIDPEEL